MYSHTDTRTYTQIEGGRERFMQTRSVLWSFLVERRFFFSNLNCGEIVFNSHNKNIHLHICLYTHIHVYVFVRYGKIRTSFHPPFNKIVLRNITTFFSRLFCLFLCCGYFLLSNFCAYIVLVFVVVTAPAFNAIFVLQSPLCCRCGGVVFSHMHTHTDKHVCMYVCKSVLLLFPFAGKFVVFIAAANFALVSLSECDKEGGETERVNARDR